MDDGSRNVKVKPDYFETLSCTTDYSQQRGLDTSVSCEDSPRTSTFVTHRLRNLFTSHPFIGKSSWAIQNCLLIRKKLRSASLMFRLFSLPGGILFSGTNGEKKVKVSAVELESLRSELADVEEREALVKAQLEHLDEILRCARLSGYLHTRTRWAALPGELPSIDDGEVDDWIPHFVVLQGPCLFFYLSSKDLSPQDSTILSEISEIGELPSFVREDGEIWHCFYIGTRYGLRIECSCVSRIQVDSWLAALRTDCKVGSDKTIPVDQNCKCKDSENCT